MNRAEKRRQQKITRKENKKYLARKPGGGKLDSQQNQSTLLALDTAVRYHSAGDLSKAEGIYRQILQTDPNQPDALHLIGTISLQVGKYEDAVELIFKSIQIKPGNVNALNNLGDALKMSGQPEKAVDYLVKAIDINPNYAEIHNNLGAALQDTGRLDEAIVSYRKAIELNPNYAEAHNNLANTLRASGHLEQAVDSYRNSIDINPNYAEAHNNLGTTLQDLGHLNEAADYFRSAIDIKPGFAAAHRHLTAVKKHSKYDDDIRNMEKIFLQPDTTDEQKMNLAFGLGKAFEDLHQYEKAFEYFVEGNSIKRKTFNFEIEQTEKHVRSLKTAFDDALFARNRAAGCANKTPIFILGMPRSGTTLVEQILASHPNVHAGGELNVLSDAVTSSFDKVKYPDRLDHVSSEIFSHLGDKYILSIREKFTDSAFVTDKMPYNFMHIGIIKLILPNARIIHCRRSPQDTCLSIFKSLFTSEGNEFSHDQIELGQYYNLYLELMDHWHTVMPGHIYDIQYEDIVGDQEEQSRALLAHCGLEWDEACLKFYKTVRPVTTASSVQVRQPIYRDSIQSWKRYEKQLSPLLKTLQ